MVKSETKLFDAATEPLSKELRELQRSATDGVSRQLADFCDDVISSCRWDVDVGNYHGQDHFEIVKQQILGSLEEAEASVRAIREAIEKVTARSQDEG